MFIRIDAKDTVVIVNSCDISHIYKENENIEIYYKNNKEYTSITAGKESINELFEYICSELEVKEW